MQCFDINPAFDVGVVVADVDMTIINDGHSELSGDNLAALVDVLKRKIPLLLISGSPYDSVYCGVATTGSLHRRVALPLRAALQQQNAAGNLNLLKIFYASGRGTATFDSLGHEIRTPDRTDRDIDPQQRPFIFRAFLGGFYAVQKNLSDENAMLAAVEKIWRHEGTEMETAAFVRRQLQQELSVDVGALETWAFGSELALVFHGRHSSGPSIAKWAQTILRRKEIKLTPDFFFAGGIDYVKASRIKKRDVIEEALKTLERNGIFDRRKIILSFGDSNVDDFLSLHAEPNASVFLGSKTDAANFPSAWLVLDRSGRDFQQANAFGFVLKSFLDQRWPADAPFMLLRPAETIAPASDTASPRP